MTPDASDAPRQVVLIGGGHAHVEVVRRWAEAPVPGASLIVVDPNPRPVYSGMVPGFVAGQYRREDLEIDLAALCRRAGATYVCEQASSIDASRQCVGFSEAEELRYTAASIDIGSTISGADLPGVREHALPSRPIDALISNIDSFIGAARGGPAGGHHITAVGAGAGGVELAFCLDARLKTAGDVDYTVSLVTSDREILASATPSLQRRVLRAAKRRGIACVVDARVAAVHEDRIELASGPSLRSSTTLWVTGPAAHAFARDSALPIDERGFIRLQRTLQIEGEASLFAVGDCASLPGMKKAGVYAVRAGPLLDRNLRAFLRDSELRPYSPQSDFLSLLNLGDGTAIGAKWGRSLEGRSVMRLKDRIDRAFMNRYR